MAIPVDYAQNSEEGVLARVWRHLTERPSRNSRSGTAGRGGANRDRCPYTAEELMAIVPVSAANDIPYLEKTSSGYPSWWFYVPYAGNARLQAEFVLVDTNEAIVNEPIVWVLESTPGLVKVDWPQTNLSLKTGSEYRWVFSIMCNPANRSGDATVNGWIQRATIGENTLNDINSIAAVNSNAGDFESLYWFDLLQAVYQGQKDNPQEYQPLWDEILCLVYQQSPQLEQSIEDCNQSLEPELR